MPSDRDPRVRYSIILNVRTLEVACDCQDCEVRGNLCKHIRRTTKFMTDLAQRADAQTAAIASVEARYKYLMSFRETVRATLMPSGASNVQLDLFLRGCAALDADPMIGEAYAFKKSDGGIQLIIGYKLFLRRAQEHPEFRDFRVGIIREGDEFAIDKINGTIKHLEGGSSKPGKITGCWVIAERVGRPVYVDRFWWDDHYRNTPFWNGNPVQAMLKVGIRAGAFMTFGIGQAAPADNTLAQGMLVAKGEDIFDLNADGTAPEASRVVDEVTGEVIEGGALEAVKAAAEAEIPPWAESQQVIADKIADGIASDGAKPDDNYTNKVPEGEAPIDAEIVSVEETEDDDPGEASSASSDAPPSAPLAENTDSKDDEPGEDSAPSPSASSAAPSEAAAATPAAASEPFGDTPHPPYEFNSAQKVTIKQVAKEIVHLDPTWDYKQFLVECQKAAVMTRDVVTKLNGILMKLKAEVKEEQPA